MAPISNVLKVSETEMSPQNWIKNGTQIFYFIWSETKAMKKKQKKK